LPVLFVNFLLGGFALFQEVLQNNKVINITIDLVKCNYPRFYAGYFLEVGFCFPGLIPETGCLGLGFLFF